MPLWPRPIQEISRLPFYQAVSERGALILSSTLLGAEGGQTVNPQIKATDLSEISLKPSFDSKRSHQMIKLSKTPSPKLQIGCVAIVPSAEKGYPEGKELWLACFI